MAVASLRARGVTGRGLYLCVPIGVRSTEEGKPAAVSQNERDATSEIPDDPKNHPEETVDALEERALGRPDDEARDEPADDSPAIEQDIDQEDLGRGGEDAGSEPSG